MTELNITTLSPGADIVRAGAHTLALGFPEEVVMRVVESDVSDEVSHD